MGFSTNTHLFYRNVFCIPVNDHSGEKNLIIELSDKEGGFTSRDLEVASLFAQNAGSIYSCCVMLAYREKVTRRNSILSQILLNIEPVCLQFLFLILKQLS
jgi:hypothetical protein